MYILCIRIKVWELSYITRCARSVGRRVYSTNSNSITSACRECDFPPPRFPLGDHTYISTGRSGKSATSTRFAVESSTCACSHRIRHIFRPLLIFLPIYTHHPPFWRRNGLFLFFFLKNTISRSKR